MEKGQRIIWEGHPINIDGERIGGDEGSRYWEGGWRGKSPAEKLNNPTGCVPPRRSRNEGCRHCRKRRITE